MRNEIPRFAGSVLVAAAIGGIIWVSAGSLNPPAGPVAPTMKTLTEVEPRTPIDPASMPYTIMQSGSYYLTGNFTATAGQTAVTINANSVTLDLNGFVLNGDRTGSDAIFIGSGVAGTVIRNGAIRHWTGVGIYGEEAAGVHVEDVHIYETGSEGVFIQAGSSVLDCSARACRTGFEVSGGVISRCTASDNTHTGFNAGGCTIADSVASGNASRGFQIGIGSTASNCSAKSNTGEGFSLGTGTTIRNCVARDNGGAGIKAIGADNRIESNHVANNAIGLDIDSTNNVVADNTVRDNSDNYDIAVGNQLSILLCELPESIDWPATVTLAGTLTGTSGSPGVLVISDNVTIDLGGHALVGVSGSGIGIAVPLAVKNVAVRNGTLRDWDTGGLSANNATNGRYGKLTASGNGGDGISVGNSSVITDCVVEDNGGDGIALGSDSRVTDCTARGNTGDGIQVITRCYVTGNTSSNNGAGIHVVGNDNRIESNHCIGGDRGLGIDGTGNYVADNTVKGAADNYDIAAGNQLNILLCEIPESIDWPATVTLAGTLTGTSGSPGVLVMSDNVTIDLGGHALVGVSGSGIGIAVPLAVKNLAVRNGTLRDWDTGGLAADNATNGRYGKLMASDNGGDGISVGDNSVITDCVVEGNGGDGIAVGTGSSVTNCTARSNTGDGIQVSTRCYVTGNTSNDSGASGGDGAGIRVAGNDNRIESNHCFGGDRGLDIDGAGNYVVDNTVKGATDNYDIAAGNQLNMLLCEIPESIDWPAKVTLAGSLTGITGQNGIDVNASDVSIDLGGHALMGVSGSQNGIYLGQVRNVAITNGIIRGWGNDGIDAYAGGGDTWSHNSALMNLRLYNNSGCGIDAAWGFRITDCQAVANGDDGIYASGRAVITNSMASLNTGRGFYLHEFGVINSCLAHENSQDGFLLLTGSAITNCTAVNNLWDGIDAVSSLVRGNEAIANGIKNIDALIGAALFENNAP